MAELSAFRVDDSIFTQIERTIWEAIKPKLCAMAWDWYDANKDHVITKFLGIYPIRFGSFGLVALFITKVLGAHP